MLLFNCINSIQSFLCASISKHLMLLFNLILHFIPPLPISISKHLMLLFNRNEQKGYQTIMVFQNISCYCLTRSDNDLEVSKLISKHLMLLFNWSNQDREWSVSFISKHLMLLFNEEKQKYFSEIAKLFQNISCYCLTTKNYYMCNVGK